MTETYVHLSGRDTDGAVLKASGIDKLKEQKTKLKWRVCLRCRSRKSKRINIMSIPQLRASK